MELIISIVIILNTLAAMITIFRETRDVSSTWAWLLVLMLLPVVGFILYLFVGKKISSDNIFDMQNQKRLGLQTPALAQLMSLSDGDLVKSNDPVEYEMVEMFLKTDKSTYMRQNAVEVIIDGDTKFNQLLTDIENAKHHIHIQYYIFENDTLGKKIMNLLYKKAREGVQVSLLYDAWGSRTLKPYFFYRLAKNGGIAKPFFGSSIPFVNLRLNYRNHRKIVVIDGEIGYTGGFNIGDDYLGQGKLGYWRDTHLRLKGEAVYALQTRFLMDWNAAVSDEFKKVYSNDFFPPIKVAVNDIPMQIVSSGPESDVDQIKMGYLKMIASAKKSIYIQTPYFIPDESILEALKIAIYSGVDVHIMIPNKPDHIGVYRATEFYAKECAKIGAKVYVYQRGFIHSKVIIIDDAISSVGTANFDIRSFKLNFEVNAFIYDKFIAKQLVSHFRNDIEWSTIADIQYFDKQSRWLKMKQIFFRLFSPIL